MRWVSEARERVRALLFRSREEEELDEEIRFHLEMETEKNVREGMSPEKARRRALLAFGGVTRHREEVRDARGLGWAEDLWRDLRYALRRLTRSPGFSLVAVLTVALGIGAVTTLFSLVDGILIRPLPYPGAERLVAVKHAAPGIGIAEAGISDGLYLHYRERTRTLEELAIYREAVVSLTGAEGEAERVELVMSGPELFRVLRVRPALGRLFTEEDTRRGFLDVRREIPVLLSHDLWRRRYGGDPGIVGRRITINDRAREVVGVLPAGFSFPRRGTQIWMVSTPDPEAAWVGMLSYDAVARLRAGATPAEAELARLLPSIEGRYRGSSAERLEAMRLAPLVEPLKETVVGDVGVALWVLFGGMGFLLLVACANVASLFLVRAEHRTHEVAARTALGASAGDLARLFFAESFLVSGLGAALGLLLAGWGLAALAAFDPLELPRLHEVGVDGRVLAFAAALMVLVALLAGGLSLLRPSRLALMTTLKSGGRGGTASRERRLARDLLVTAQIALALVLFVGSALMAQSFWRLSRVDPGFDPAGVLTLEAGLPFSRAAQHQRIYEELLERVRALPGVEAAAGVSELPLTEDVWTSSMAYPLRVSGRPARPEETERSVLLRFFLPGYFQAMGIPVVEGTGLGPDEAAPAPHPVVVSAALARRLFPDGSAVGGRIRRLGSSGNEIDSQPDYTVVGVAGDVREGSLRDAPAEVVYLPVAEPRVDPDFIPTEFTLVVRSDAPMALVEEVRRAVAETEPALVVANARTLEEIVRTSTARESFLMALLLIAGGVSLFLGGVGIYGVLSYVVSQRVPELGVRMALGASPGGMLRMVVRQGALLALAGIAVGIPAALALTRILRGLLFEVSPSDPAAFAGTALLLLVIALAASFLPARRAARIDPARVLGAE